MRTERREMGVLFLCNKRKINRHSALQTATGCSRLCDPASAPATHTLGRVSERENRDGGRGGEGEGDEEVKGRDGNELLGHL